jgi:hypothetical protein
MEWLKETVLSIKIGSENRTNKVFDADSPIALTPAGRIALYGSGMKAYIDKHKRDLLMHCDNSRCTDPYEFQGYAFRMFMTLQLDATFDRRLRRFAFASGMSTDLLRRVGAIYFRDIAGRSS